MERIAASTAYGERAKALARARLSTLRTRLVEGDFSVGERVLVQVQGQTVNQSDTLTILDSLVLAVPNIRRVRLTGVLRSELQDLMRREVAEVVRGANVRATSLMRVAVLGEVSRPGYLTVPPETFVDQLLTMAGGPTANAALDKARFVRGDTVLAEGGEIRLAIAAGRSLAHLDLRNGDALVLPTRAPPWSRESTVQIALVFLAPLVTVLLVR